jgi:hypothetical protein
MLITVCLMSKYFYHCRNVLQPLYKKPKLSETHLIKTSMCITLFSNNSSVAKVFHKNILLSCCIQVRDVSFIKARRAKLQEDLFLCLLQRFLTNSYSVLHPRERRTSSLLRSVMQRKGIFINVLRTILDSNSRLKTQKTQKYQTYLLTVQESSHLHR